MIFNDDSMLDFRGNGFGDSLLDGIFGYDAGEVVITGRVPGALYVDDFSDGEYGLQHIQPLDYTQNEIGSVITVDTSDLADTNGLVEDTLAPVVEPGDDAGAALVAANDDDAPSAIVALSHAKSEEPLVLPVADSSGGGVGELHNADPLDLGIPAIPLPAFDAPSVDLATMPTADEPAPVFVGGRAYESLSFLIIDTPFAVGDDQLPDTLRPSLIELLGLTLPSDDDAGQAFVLPATGWGSWRLG